jgi:hypothetical protein
MDFLQSLGGISGIVGVFTLVFIFLFWPAILFYCVYSALRSLHRIANALDHVAYDVPRMRRDIVKAAEERAESHAPHVANSAFGR